jgi:CRISPR type I-E-associated protein CasB/Cse2
MPSDDQQPTWRSTIGAMAHEIRQPTFPPGHLAQLRRLDAERPGGIAFWQLVAKHAPLAFDDERLAEALAIVLRGMAITREFLTTERRGLGKALAESGVSELRLLRLLRADKARLDEETRQIARLLASKGESGRFDWSEVLWLVLTADTEKGESCRRAIARDYYRMLFETKSTSEEKAA